LPESLQHYDACVYFFSVGTSAPNHGFLLISLVDFDAIIIIACSNEYKCIKLHDAFDRLHDAMNRLHDAFDRLHDEMNRLHHAFDRLHDEMNRLHDAFDHLRDEMNRLHDAFDHPRDEMNTIA
jgi:uncharacterized protein YukE